jgi:hypothetical protein
MGMAKSGILSKPPRPARVRRPHRRAEPGDGALPPGVSVRALRRTDLPAAAALVRETFQLGPRHTEPALAAFLARTLLDQPWADPEIRSLVAVDERGVAVGFVAAEVRRMWHDGRTLRFAWAGHSAVAPAARTRAVGFLLMQKLLEGPQDATLGDSASPLMEQMWLRLGGRRLELKGVHWVRVFRPSSVLAHLVAPRRPRLRAGVRALAGGLDDLTRPVARPLIAPRRPTAGEEPLTPQGILEAMPRVARRLTLRPDYDEGFLEWLFSELPRARSRGQVVARLVRDLSGRTIGWYVYFLRPGWRSEVLQVAATGERALSTVLDHLLHHAYTHGSAALRGRLEPGILAAVAQRRCVLWHRGATVVHARDPHVLEAIEAPGALVSRLDGDPWVNTLVDVIP